MKVKVLFAALAGLVLASCTNNEQLLDETKKGREIRFAVASQTAQTRAEHDIDVPYDGKLKIWAWDADNYSNIIINGDLYDAANKAFLSGKNYYYPVDGGDVLFYAVKSDAENIADVDGGAADNYYTAPVVNGSTISVNFNTPSVDHHTVDLVTSEFITQASGTVGIVLRHLFARLDVRVQQIARANEATQCLVKVNKLEFRSLKKSGSVTIDNAWNAIEGDKFWDNEDGEGTWSIISADYPLCAGYDPLTSALTNFMTTSSHFVLPQSLLNNEQKLYIKYNVSTKYLNGQPTVSEDFEKELSLSSVADNIQKWAMNKHITYILTINPLEDSQKITFDFDVEEWGSVVGSNGVDHATL